MILDVIEKTIAEYSLLEDGDTVLVALSGGADSVCLLHALAVLRTKLGISVYAAHLNHGIRGKEALHDENLAKSFSKSLGIEFFSKSMDIPALAKKTHTSEETAGRIARYEFFEELCEKHNIKKIATAHNRNDNAETLIMNFIRGSATNGLCGIPYKRGKIIRPLLDVRRCDIERYCAENKLEYATDSTNLSNDYTRNKIRHIILPLIEKEFNSNFVNTVSENSILIKEDNEYINSVVQSFFSEHVKDNSLLCEELLEANIAVRRRVIRLMLKNVYGGLEDVGARYIDDILALLTKSGSVAINLSDGASARVEYGRLIIDKSQNTASEFCIAISLGGAAVISEAGIKVTTEYVKERKKDGALYLSCEDSDKIIIRSRKSGDKFLPLGMNGTKKVKSYFIDNKVPLSLRTLVPIVEINGEIAAVGDRPDRRFAFKNKGIRIKYENI